MTRQLVFVYGTLKRGGENHAVLTEQEFVGPARTSAGYTMYGLDGYPGIVPDARDTAGITGEVWAVSPAALEALDALEGVAEGLYARVPIPLLAPFADRVVQTYLYLRSVEGRPMLGDTWEVR